MDTRDRSGPDAILTIVETSLYAEDLDRALVFYRDVLDLPLKAHEEGRHVFFHVGRSSVLLIFHAEATLRGDHLPAHGASGPGHLAFGIPAESLARWRERLTGHGVSIEHETDWSRGGHSLYFRDPAGNLVELITPGVWGLSAGW